MAPTIRWSSAGNPADNSYRPLFSVGGKFLGDPVAMATTAGIEVFVRGSDNRIYANTMDFPRFAGQGWAFGF